MNIENYELSQEQHMKDYPKGYEIVLDKPQKIEIEYPDDSKEQYEVVEIHLYWDKFSNKWKIAFEREHDGSLKDLNDIRIWRFTSIKESRK
jgi:hypothetical protein